MSDIKLGKPYDDFIQWMIKSEYYGSVEELLRDALRDKMQEELFFEMSKNRNSTQKNMSKEQKEKTLEFVSDLLTKMKNMSTQENG